MTLTQRLDRPARLLVSLVVLSLSAGCMAKAAPSELTIAVVAPLSGKTAFMGVPLKEGAKLAVDEVNAKGGIGGKKVRLLVVDDANDPRIAEQRARELAGDGQTLAVLGHRTSETCVPAGKIYAQAGLPAITASASAPEVTAGNPWYFRLVPETGYQGRFLAQYARQVLGWKSMRLIMDSSAYGQSLGRAFKEAAAPLGLELEREWEVPHKGADLETRLAAAGAQIAATSAGRNTPILLAAGEAVAVRLLMALRDGGDHAQLLSGHILGNPAFNEHFQDTPADRKEPGFYTDGLITAAVGLTDAVGEAAQRYYQRYGTTYHRAADILSAAYYDAAMLAMQGLEETQAAGSELRGARQRLRDWLARIDSPSRTFVGTTGRLFFDATHNAVKSVPVGRFDGTRFVAAPVQLDLIARPEGVPNFEAERQAGNIVELGGLYWSKVQVVYVGVDVLGIPDINQHAGEFTADMFVWFRYQGPSPVAELELPTAAKPVTFGNPVWVRQRRDLTVATYRVSGTFKAHFDYTAYPLDRQVFPIVLRHMTKTVSTFIMATDLRGMTLKDRRFEELALAKLQTSFAGTTWRVANVLSYQSIFKSDSTLGEYGLAYADTGLEYSQINATIEVRRHFASFFTKNVLPLALILMVLYMCNFLPASEINTQVTIGLTTLLTCILLYQSLSSELSTIGYLTLIDYIYFLSFALCIFQTLASVYTYTVDKAGLTKQLKRARRAGLFLIPSALLLVTLIVYLWRRTSAP